MIFQVRTTHNKTSKENLNLLQNVRKLSSVCDVSAICSARHSKTPLFISALSGMTTDEHKGRGANVRLIPSLIWDKPPSPVNLGRSCLYSQSIRSLSYISSIQNLSLFQLTCRSTKRATRVLHAESPPSFSGFALSRICITDFSADAISYSNTLQP